MIADRPLATANISLELLQDCLGTLEQLTTGITNLGVDATEDPTQTTTGEQRPLTVQSFDKELRRVCDWNGLSGVSSHSFRRTQLTELYREGWSLREIQHISGHKSLQSLQEYLDVDKEKVVNKFRSRMEVVR